MLICFQQPDCVYFMIPDWKTMINVTLDSSEKRPLYEQLYRRISEKIETGAIRSGDKLPSKRSLAAHLGVSMRTVENAYAQLAVEGYVQGVEKRAYFVRDIGRTAGKRDAGQPPTAEGGERSGKGKKYAFDLGTGRLSPADFPFSTWAKLMRESLRDRTPSLLAPIHPQGNPELRREIARHLRQFRGMEISAEQVLLGAGTEFLLGLITELLPTGKFALENPSYHKPAKILRSRKIPFAPISLDAEGLRVDRLEASRANAILTTPSHHFPLCTVMGINRRMQLLRWVGEKKNRFIIEDDYDSEFRYDLRPVPPLYSLDRAGKVIYVNTFTQTLAPSLRIAYMVLPPSLLWLYRKKVSFYACTVSEFEQCTMQRFLEGGYYERHLNRMRTVNKKRRDALIRGLAPLSGSITIHGKEAGLHLLLSSKRGVGESALLERAKRKGVRVLGLSGYYLGKPENTQTVVAGYSGYEEEQLARAAGSLCKAWK